MSFIDATFHAAQDLIYALQNPAPRNKLSKLGNGHKEALRTLLKIFRKSSPPAIPLRVAVRKVFEEKPKEVNQMHLKNLHKCITSECAYCRVITRVTPTSELSKTIDQIISTNQKQ